MRFKPFFFPISSDADSALAAVREFSERATLRPSPFTPACRPFRELVLTPIPAAARIVTWHPASDSTLNSQLSTLA